MYISKEYCTKNKDGFWDNVLFSTIEDGVKSTGYSAEDFVRCYSICFNDGDFVAVKFDVDELIETYDKVHRTETEDMEEFPKGDDEVYIEDNTKEYPENISIVKRSELRDFLLS